MKKGVNQLKAGSVISYVQMALNVVISLLYTPVILRLLGKSEYGLYSTVSSTIAMLSILSLGFNSGYIRYFARYKKQQDEDAIAKLNGLFLIIFSVIGVVALACGLYLSFHLDLVFDEGLLPSEYRIARVLMLLLTANLAISFPMSVFQSIISANERFVFLKSLSVIKTVVGPLITLPLLLMGCRSIAMVSVTVGVSLAVDICCLIFVKRCLHNRFVFYDFEPGLLKSLFVYTGFIALNMIIDQINWNVDKILLARFKGTDSVAVYAVAFTLFQCYQLLSTSVSGVFTPRIHKLVNHYQDTQGRINTELTELFTKVGRIQYLILALVAGGICFFGKPFIRFWAGEGYTNAYYVALLLVLPSSVALIQNVGIEIQRAENKHRFRSIAYAIMAAVNLIASIFLCQIYGEIGAAIGTAVSLLIANGLIMNVYYYRQCGIDIPYFWKNILQQSVGLIIPVAAGFLLNRLFTFDSIVKLLAGIAAYTLIYCISMWTFGMNRYEKDLISRPIKNLLKRT